MFLFVNPKQLAYKLNILTQIKFIIIIIVIINRKYNFTIECLEQGVNFGGVRSMCVKII